MKSIFDQYSTNFYLIKANFMVQHKPSPAATYKCSYLGSNLALFLSQSLFLCVYTHVHAHALVTEQGLTAGCPQKPIPWRPLGRKEKNNFIERLTYRKTDGRVQICFSDSGFGGTFKMLRWTGWYVDVLAGQVSIGGLWNLALYGKIL